MDAIEYFEEQLKDLNKILGNPAFDADLRTPLTIWVGQSEQLHYNPELFFREVERDGGETARPVVEPLRPALQGAGSYLMHSQLALQMGISQDYLTSLKADGREASHARHMIRIVRDIADGIAWRALRFDRFTIRALSQGHQGATVEGPDGARYLVEQALEAKTEALPRHPAVLINDTTNCLRRGDLTLVFADGSIDLKELKRGTTGKKDRRARRQRDSREAALEAVESRTLTEAGGVVVKEVVSDFSPCNYFPRLSELFAQTLESGVATTFPTSHLAVRVIRPNVWRKHRDSRIALQPFNRPGDFMVVHSHLRFALWDSFRAPISVFPISVADRVSLLTGDVQIESYLDVKGLINEFRRRGIEAQFPPWATFQGVGKLPSQLHQANPEDSINLKRASDGREARIGLGVLSRYVLEYLEADSFFALVDAFIEASDPSMKETRAVYLANEEALWR